MNRQLSFLFVCNLLIFSTANGLLPLLPVYATDLGASATLVGGYMGFAYAMLAAGTLSTSRLAQRAGSARRLFMGVLLLAALGIVLMGQVSALWQLVLLTGVVWFCGGIAVALIAILTGLLATAANRGRVFGLMFLGQPLGTLVGGMMFGALVDGWGYAALFGLMSVSWLGAVVLAAAGLEEHALVSGRDPARAETAAAGFAPAFYALLAASLLTATAAFVGRLGTSLSMQSLDFSTRAITQAAAVGGLVVLPVVPVLGILSDRVGRRGFLAACYLLGGAGLLILSLSHVLWHFWLAAVCFSVANYAGSAVAAALAVDELPPAALGRGMPRLNAMSWIGGIVGFSSAGYLIDLVGYNRLYVGAAVLAPLAVLVLWLRLSPPVSYRTSRPKPVEVHHGG